MLRITGLRLISAFITALASFIFPPTEFKLILAILGLTHYGVAFFYSRSIAWKLLSTSQTGVPFLILVGAITLSTIFRWPPMVFFFGFHHLASEIYTPSSFHSSLETESQSREFICLKVAFHSICYALLARDLLPFPIFQFLWQTAWPVWALLITTLWYLSKLGETEASRQAKQDLFLAEGLFAGAAIGSYFVTVGFAKVLFYHFIFWAIFPISKLKLGGPKKIVEYGALTALVALLIALSLTYLPQNQIGNPIHADALSRLANQGFYYLTLIGFIHIGLSLALSRHNPNLIRRWFYPQANQRPNQLGSS